MLILITALSNISGCATSVKPIEVVSKPVERTRLDIPNPEPLKARPIKWLVITKDNSVDVFKKMEDLGQDPVVFALTDEGYQQLSMSIAEIRNLISTQRTIINKYKEYYEPAAAPDDKK